jgi:hypothetical protein
MLHAPLRSAISFTTVFNESELSALETQLSEDLEAIRRVKNLLAKQRNGTSQNVVSSQPEETLRPIPEAGPQNSRPALGDVNQAVLEVLQFISGQFTGSDVLQKLKAKGHDFRNSSVRAVFHRLVKTGKIEIKSQGKGRRATIYSKPQHN